MEDLRALVIAAQSGDQEAFGRIVTRFQGIAYAVMYAVVMDSALAQAPPKRRSSMPTSVSLGSASRLPFLSGSVGF
jgi:hypothetical protein